MKLALTALVFAASTAVGASAHAQSVSEPTDPEKAPHERMPCPSSAQAVHACEPARMLVADLGMHVIGFGYQHMASRFVAGQIVLAYYQPWTQNIDFLGLSGEANKGGDLRGMIARARVFFHPFGAAPTGFWISPFAQAGIGWGRRNGEREAGAISAAGLSVGYSTMLSKAILLGGGFGLQVHSAQIPGGNDPPSFSRFYPQVEIQLGYLF